MFSVWYCENAQHILIDFFAVVPGIIVGLAVGLDTDKYGGEAL